MSWLCDGDVIFDKENKQIDGKYVAISEHDEETIGYLVVEETLGWDEPNIYKLYFNKYVEFSFSANYEPGLDSVRVYRETIKKYTQIEEIKNLLRRGRVVHLLKQCHTYDEEPKDNLIATINFEYEIPYKLWELKEETEYFQERDIKPFDNIHFADSDGRQMINHYKNDRWRSIEMPPDSSRTVLIQLSFGSIVTGYYMDNEWWACNFGSQNKKIDKDIITCWNDLPKPYKGNEL